MDQLMLRYERFCWWLQELVHRIAPYGEHECAIHGRGWIRTFKRTGKLCMKCNEEPMSYYQDLMHSGPALYDVVVTPEGVKLEPVNGF